MKQVEPRRRKQQKGSERGLPAPSAAPERRGYPAARSGPLAGLRAGHLAMKNTAAKGFQTWVAPKGAPIPKPDATKGQLGN